MMSFGLCPLAGINPIDSFANILLLYTQVYCLCVQ